MMGTHLLALHALWTSWANAPWGTGGTRSTVTAPGTRATNNARSTLCRAEREARGVRAPQPQSRHHGHPLTLQLGTPQTPAPAPSLQEWGFVVTSSLVT